MPSVLGKRFSLTKKIEQKMKKLLKNVFFSIFFQNLKGSFTLLKRIVIEENVKNLKGNPSVKYKKLRRKVARAEERALRSHIVSSRR